MRNIVSIVHNPEAALDVLRRVKVCDPACGSGAYLLGMLHELLDLRACLFATTHLDSISTYQRKLEIIQNNIYGVDLDPFAVNIALLQIDSLRKMHAEFRLAFARVILICQMATLSLMIAGVVFLTRGTGGFYWIVAATLLSFLATFFDTWVLVIEINR